jgi:uncharacterized protein YjfI (DUF2170 family)
MNETKKDFINVAKLSAEFNQFVANNEKAMSFSSIGLHLWQVQAQFAIAQQLTIIASHLGKIVGKAEELK